MPYSLWGVLLRGKYGIQELVKVEETKNSSGLTIITEEYSPAKPAPVKIKKLDEDYKKIGFALTTKLVNGKETTLIKITGDDHVEFSGWDLFNHYIIPDFIKEDDNETHLISTKSLEDTRKSCLELGWTEHHNAKWWLTPEELQFGVIVDENNETVISIFLQEDVGDYFPGPRDDMLTEDDFTVVPPYLGSSWAECMWYGKPEYNRQEIIDGMKKLGYTYNKDLESYY